MTNNAKKTVAQVVLRWRTEREAMEDCVSANFARFEWKEKDIYSIIRSNQLTPDRLKDATGLSESTLARYYKVAPHEWLTKLVDEKCVGYSKAAKWIDACNENQEKLEVLEHAMTAKYDSAKKSAEKYQNDENRGKLADNDIKKKDIEYWFNFNKGELDDLISSLKRDDGVVKDSHGNCQIHVDPTKVSGKSVATIGLDDEWKTNLVLNNFFEREADDVPVESYDNVIDEWPSILKKLIWHRDRLRRQEYQERHPLPASGERVEDETRQARPKDQTPKSEEIESGDPDSEEAVS